MTTTIIVLSVSSTICLVLLYYPFLMKFGHAVVVAERKSEASATAVDFVGNSETTQMPSGGKKPFSKIGFIILEGVHCEGQNTTL